MLDRKCADLMMELLPAVLLDDGNRDGNSKRAQAFSDRSR